MGPIKSILLTSVGASVLVAAPSFAGTLTGTVKGLGDGAALSGALITVQETGQSVATRQDGSYRIANLPAGTYTLSVSYLGFEGESASVAVDAEGTVRSDFALVQMGAETPDTIVVRGARLGQNRSLSEQRANLNVTNVVSADALGKFPDNNIAESVSRLPGITLVRDQQTGEGSFVTIRGLDTRLNTYNLNGVRLATADAGSRGISLNQLPPDGLQSVEVSKTLRPDMDGDAIGGTIDFRTPSAFDYDGMSAGGSITTDYNDRNGDTGYNVSGFFGDTFGAQDEYGFYITGYYQDKSSTGEESENEGDWEPYRWRNGSNDRDVDAQTLQMQGVGLDLFENDLKRYGFNTTLDRRFNDGSKVWFRGQYSFYEDAEDHTYFDVRNSRNVSINGHSGRLVQKNLLDASLSQPWQVITGQAGALGNVYGYTTDQIVDRDNDGLITDADRSNSDPMNGSTGRLYSLIGKSGVWDPRRLRIGRGFSWRTEEYELWSANLGGEHFVDAFTIEWDLAYSSGRTARTEDAGIDFGRDGAAPFDQSGVLYAFPNPRYPQWILPGTLAQDIYDPANLDLQGGDASEREATDNSVIGQIDVDWDVTLGFLDRIEFGGKVRRQEHEVDENPVFEGKTRDLTLAQVLAINPAFVGQAEYGDFLSGYYSGKDSFGMTFNRNALQHAFNSCDDRLFSSCETSFSDDEMTRNDRTSKETVYAGYAMGVAEWNDWQVFGGVRVEHTEVENDYFSSVRRITLDEGGVELDDVTVARRGSSEGSYTNVLPSIHVNYRPNENWVYRGAIWTSIARPNFEDMTSRESVSVSQTRLNSGSIRVDGVSISRGNADLKPTEALNFDLGFEYYSPNGGLISANIFYKDLENFIYFDFRNDGTVKDTFEGQPADVATVANGPEAKLYGIELGLVQQFTALPSPWDGLGVAANVTIQESETTPSGTRSAGQGDKVDLINAPNLGYNAQIFYEKYGLEARLAYNFSGDYVEDLRNNGINKIVQDWDRLDFQLRYTFANGFSIRGEVQNILDGHNYWATRGYEQAFQKDYVENGRSFFLGADYRF
ncbi:TonB-dependent receptor [Woodsholea maritima]|uniref:TonB-dependent receptor n=1 Tax=Woodsholea maritima TaxID=240237 RepID=UPI00035F0683|nr:TonB-dependent receptor [Woodsholea maritima]